MILFSRILVRSHSLRLVGIANQIGDREAKKTALRTASFPAITRLREAAREFKNFLEGVVWQSRDLSPGLAGTPTARILREVAAPSADS